MSASKLLAKGFDLRVVKFMGHSAVLLACHWLICVDGIDTSEKEKDLKASFEDQVWREDPNYHLFVDGDSFHPRQYFWVKL